MNDQESSETGFARRLRAELKSVVAERDPEPAQSRPPTRSGKRHRGLRVSLAGVAVLGIAAAVLVIGAGGGDTPAAFAVDTDPEGSISVEVNTLEDPAGLETALEEAGVPASVSYLDSGMTCKEPRYQAASSGRGLVSGPGALVGGAMSGAGPITFTIDRDEVGPGQTLVITASPRPGALLGEAEMKIAEGAVAPCEPVPTLVEDTGGGDK